MFLTVKCYTAGDYCFGDYSLALYLYKLQRFVGTGYVAFIRYVFRAP